MSFNDVDKRIKLMELYLEKIEERIFTVEAVPNKDPSKLLEEYEVVSKYHLQLLEHKRKMELQKKGLGGLSPEIVELARRLSSLDSNEQKKLLDALKPSIQ